MSAVFGLQKGTAMTDARIDAVINFVREGSRVADVGAEVAEGYGEGGGGGEVEGFVALAPVFGQGDVGGGVRFGKGDGRGAGASGEEGFDGFAGGHGAASSASGGRRRVLRPSGSILTPREGTFQSLRMARPRPTTQSPRPDPDIFAPRMRGSSRRA